MHTTLDTGTTAAAAAAKRSTFVRYCKDGPPPQIRVIEGLEVGDSPLATLIIPVADETRAGNLAVLLAQLAQQTFQRFEAIIVEGDTRQGRAINTAAAIARGGILITMDDDTRLGHADLLEKLARAFESDSTIGIAGVSNLIPADVPWVVRRAMRELPRRSSALVDRITNSDMAEHPCLAIRKEVFYRVGGEHELIPRGLDPYLRREVRRLGFRVVVIPNAWIHHLLPPRLTGILRQYFRNGKAAAYVKKFYPQFIIDQAEDHFQQVPGDRALLARTLRYLGRLVVAFITLRWIYLGALVSYGLGYGWGLCLLKEDSL